MSDLPVNADNEWGPLRSVIVGRAQHSCFPSEPKHMIEATMPEEHWSRFVPANAFDHDILKKADEELDGLVALLERDGIKVYRPESVDWVKVGGYTGAMPRDGLLTVGTHVIEAPPDPDTIYDGRPSSNEDEPWAVNNTRPSFDAADFMRFGKTILGQLSHVTNLAGVEWLRKTVPSGYKIEIVAVNDPHAMHIDATILPLRQGLLVYNPHRVTEDALRKHDVLRDWRLVPYPFQPSPRTWPPRYMTSGWLLMNTLSLDPKRVICEASDTEFADFIRDLGMEPILLPFQHVHSIGGSFHCATVDLVRQD